MLNQWDRSFPSFWNHAITINQCFNGMQLISQASVFAYFTISHSFIPGRNVNLASWEVFSLFYFAGACHHRDIKSSWPWMAMFIPKHSLSEVVFVACVLLFFYFGGGGGEGGGGDMLDQRLSENK